MTLWLIVSTTDAGGVTVTCTGSWSRMMPQSAENTTRGIPGVSVTMASTLV